MKRYDTKVTVATIKNDIRNPGMAVIEAISNSIDADSKNIYIYAYANSNARNSLFPNNFNIDILDDGIGIPIEDKEFEEVFCNYKVSKKKDKINYGQKGKGRYTYIAATNDLSDIVIYTKSNDKFFKILFIEDNQKICIVKETCEQPEAKFQNFKTFVSLNNVNVKYILENESKKEYFINVVKDDIISFFADRIASKSINFFFNDELLNIDNYLEKDVKKSIPIKYDDIECKFDTVFYMWNNKVSLKADRQKHILIFDSFSKLKAILPSGKHKLSFSNFKQNHSIVVRSSYFDDKDYIVDDSCSIFNDKILEILKEKITIELDFILLNIYKNHINEISDEYMKYFRQNLSEIEDKVYRAILFPFIYKIGPKQISDNIKKIISKLIDRLLQSSPENYLNNIEYILNLNDKDNSQIKYIETNYGLIKAVSEKSKYIERIDFLNRLSEIVNGKNKHKTQERTQLHHIIDKNLWIFGEEFEHEKNKVYSDQSIKTILESEYQCYEYNSEEVENNKKIPDIYIQINNQNKIYIIELKKPGVKINDKIMNEIWKKYIKTFNSYNKKFANSAKKQFFAYAISDDKTEDAMSRGDIEIDGIKIIPYTWEFVINKARESINDKVAGIDNKIKESKWKDLDEFIKNYNQG